MNFYSKLCVIQEKNSGKIKCMGKAQNGLYYLIMSQLKLVASYSKKIVTGCQSNTILSASSITLPGTARNVQDLSSTTLWHERLGHAPLKRMNKIPHLNNKLHKSDDLCLICPLAKFTKLPFRLCQSRASQALKLIHIIDIWGSYKVPRNYKYFLTLVDDYSRVTWVHLLRENLAHLK